MAETTKRHSCLARVLEAAGRWLWKGKCSEKLGEMRRGRVVHVFLLKTYFLPVGTKALLHINRQCSLISLKPRKFASKRGGVLK